MSGIPMTNVAHRKLPMNGRDPHESGRAATPLELLFDLTFVVAFGTAGNELAHAIAAGHATSGLMGFAFAVFGICWAWINFTWFASAFDTDDWLYRLLTMLQMIGVVILALGLPTMFASLEEHHGIDNRVMVLGYVVMRVAMISQWLRAARQCPDLRQTCLTYVAAIAVAQIGWVALALAHTSVAVFALAGLMLFAIELAGPVLAERRGPTPWHAHHVAERYGLLAIITLGEGVIGMVATLGAATADGGWDAEAGIIALAGMGLTFGMWWVYFAIPFADILHAHRERPFAFGYGHIFLFGAIAGVGAGMHVAGYYLEAHHEPEEFAWVHVGLFGTVLSVAVPVAVFVLGVYALWSHMLKRRDPLHFLLLGLTAGVIVLALVLASAHASLAVCLLVLCLAPAISVVGYELVGHRHQAEAMGSAPGHPST